MLLAQKTQVWLKGCSHWATGREAWLLTMLQTKAWLSWLHMTTYLLCHMGCQVSANRCLYDSPGRRADGLWMPPSARGHPVHQTQVIWSSGRTWCCGINMGSRLSGAWVHVWIPLLNSNILFDTWQFSQSQMPHLENRNNNPYLIGSLWKSKTKDAECLAPDRYSLYTYVGGGGVGRGYGCGCGCVYI